MRTFGDSVSSLLNQMMVKEWNLQWVKDKLKDPRTWYVGRPELFDANEALENGEITINHQGYLIKVNGQEYLIPHHKKLSILESTFAQINKIITKEKDNPCWYYFNEEKNYFENLSIIDNYGFYVLYFDIFGTPSYLVHFPPLPIFKFSILASVGDLYRDSTYEKSWYQLRGIFNHSHIMVAGASVAAGATLGILRDFRPTYITIGDPKPPNITNFNRTEYNVIDVASLQSKVICFARHVHAQDPTQIIYLEKEGFDNENFLTTICGENCEISPTLLIEAIDDIKTKIAIIKMAKQYRIPTIQLADVGSKAQINFISPSDMEKNPDLALGLSSEKVDTLLELDFVTTAAMMTGLENAVEDEIGCFVKGDKKTPFGNTVPQLGSTSLAAAALATEQAARYLLLSNQTKTSDFKWRRITLDKKRLTLKKQTWPPLKAQVLNKVMEIKMKKNQK